MQSILFTSLTTNSRYESIRSHGGITLPLVLNSKNVTRLTPFRFG
jgi:hypothetical protein